jgi:tetratricopeptide (TPR) repeat protein
LALQAIVSLVQNEKERALELSKRAVTADPQSAAALISLSYAQQANFDLEAARVSLQQAVQVSPDNTLAWARLAELWLMFGQLYDALDAAQKAVSLDPGLARTHTVLGFAYLTQVNTNDARRAFERTIELDQADPMPRLGLGLAKIKDGELVEGRKEIDIAVSLDPDNALVRSYLGKAYFEQKMDKQASAQYEMSKLLDPKDPTPYFYDAIRKQTTNRPVEALQDLQTAIELNDNRAVYRSRLLLDSDLAARSAALGRIYSDLGFQQLALVEGWRSVSVDPSNFSAHRLLADSYSILPRHEIARVSELLRSQLLQPINITPIPPSLAESNLLLISAGGPAGASFNEFHPLFNRNGINLQTTGLTAENNTYAGEGVISGIYKKASFSLGGLRFQTDGWRQNADQKATIGNGFLQFEASPATSIQAEYRFKRTGQGDLQLNFFPEDFFPDRRQKEETHTYRAGVRHSFLVESILLGSFMYQNQDVSVRDRPSDFFTIDLKDPSKAFGSELQHLFRSQYVSVNSGIGHFNVDRELRFRILLNFPGLPSFEFRRDLDARHTNAYVYSYINPQSSVTYTLGASGDFFKTDDIDSDSRNQFNPKFGVAWSIVPNTTVRAAAFRVLKRTLITNQTLEPPQVAGFNQFYDDLPSTESWRYGIGIDHKLSESVFGGMEFSRRDLNVPAPAFRASERENANEQVGRAYVFWTPHQWLAVSGEYMYERFRNDDAISFFFKKVDTHRVPLGLRFFHPSGFSAALRATFFHQSGEFNQQSSGTFMPGRDTFWVADAAISYRLPKRYGFITLGVTNLFDRRFKYQQTDFAIANSVSANAVSFSTTSGSTTIQPDRTVFVRVTLAFP